MANPGPWELTETGANVQDFRKKQQCEDNLLNLCVLCFALKSNKREIIIWIKSFWNKHCLDILQEEASEN